MVSSHSRHTTSRALRALFGGIRRGSRLRMVWPAFVALACFLNGCALIARRGTIAYLAVTAQTTDMKLQINKAFIERYKNRVTIHTTFTVDRAMQSPFPVFLDGDLHLAGRAPQIGLPTVGEIANAASQKEAVDIVRRAEGTGKPLKVSGGFGRSTRQSRWKSRGAHSFPMRQATRSMSSRFTRSPG